MKKTTVEHITAAAKKVLEQHRVEFELGYNDVYRFRFQNSSFSTIELNEQFEVQGTKFIIENAVLSLQSEVDKEQERLKNIHEITVSLPQDKFKELTIAVAEMTGLPQKLITDGKAYYIVDHGKYASNGEYRKMKVIVSYFQVGVKQE